MQTYLKTRGSLLAVAVSAGALFSIPLYGSQDTLQRVREANEDRSLFLLQLRS